MKAFLVTVSSLCLCGILLCFLAYATGNFPFVPRVYDRVFGVVKFDNSENLPKPTQLQQVVMQTPSIETDPLCSPCVERMVLLMETIKQEWEEKQLIPIKNAAQGWAKLSPEQREKAKQLFDQFGTEEGLRRLRESDPEAARRFEQERRGAPFRDVPDKGQSESKD